MNVQDWQQQCPGCAGTLSNLPLPHHVTSVLSDGRISQQPIKKAACETCGLVVHRTRLSNEDVRRFYDGAYDLGLSNNRETDLRNNAYARFIIELLGRGRPTSVLEIGCGSGNTLMALAQEWPDCKFRGLEAAQQLVQHQIGNRQIEVQHGFAEDLKIPMEPFDLVFSINVIEHSVDAREFLRSAAAQVAGDGQVIVICPRSEPPNLELLFQDHIYSFPRQAFQRIADGAGLSLERAGDCPAMIGDFQYFVLKLDSNAQASAPEARKTASDPLSLQRLGALTAYLEAWSRLEDSLNMRTDVTGSVRIFGAGEMAALIRGYAPAFWQRVSELVVDEVVGARDLGKPVRKLLDVSPDIDDALVVATHPRSQFSVAERLNREGYRTICFADLISR